MWLFKLKINHQLQWIPNMACNYGNAWLCVCDYQHNSQSDMALMSVGFKIACEAMVLVWAESHAARLVLQLVLLPTQSYKNRNIFRCECKQSSKTAMLYLYCKHFLVCIITHTSRKYKYGLCCIVFTTSFYRQPIIMTFVLLMPQSHTSWD